VLSPDAPLLGEVALQRVEVAPLAPLAPVAPVAPAPLVSSAGPGIAVKKNPQGSVVPRPGALAAKSASPAAEAPGGQGSSDMLSGMGIRPMNPSIKPSEVSKKTPVAAVRYTGALVQLGQDGAPSASFPLLDEAITIGSREGEVLIPNDHYLSPAHARVYREGAQWFVRDLGSVNGVYKKVRGSVDLQDGDVLLAGQQLLRFEVAVEGERHMRPALQHGVHVFGSPARTKLARLCQRTVEGVTRDVYHLHRNETSLGRESADIVFTDDPYLSRRHVLFRYDANAKRFFLEDMGSYNGTFLAIREPTPLVDGDTLRVGLHMFRVELSRKSREVSEATPNEVQGSNA
jgi:pSer/pThr/pTyr-binding forkhead associated (FHA) protein